MLKELEYQSQFVDDSKHEWLYQIRTVVDRLNNYLTEEEVCYVVLKSLRERVLFHGPVAT